MKKLIAATVFIALATVDLSNVQAQQWLVESALQRTAWYESELRYNEFNLQFSSTFDEDDFAEWHLNWANRQASSCIDTIQMAKVSASIGASILSLNHSMSLNQIVASRHDHAISWLIPIQLELTVANVYAKLHRDYGYEWAKRESQYRFESARRKAVEALYQASQTVHFSNQARWSSLFAPPNVPEMAPFWASYGPHLLATWDSHYATVATYRDARLMVEILALGSEQWSSEKIALLVNPARHPME